MNETRQAFEEHVRWAEQTSPLYAALCRAIADDEDLLALAEHVPTERSVPNVFLAAIHYELLRGADGDLAAFYPSVVDDPLDPDVADRGPRTDDPNSALAEALHDFCVTHREALVPLLETRRTQTNAVRRCAALYPGFAHVADLVDGPFATIEVGPSAGLNLRWDHYRYEYDGPALSGSDPRVVGATDSPVTIATECRGDVAPPLPERPPPVHSRVGVDLNPMDVTDDRDVDWLRALTWPEHRDRRAVLEAAIDAAREDPPGVVEGDVLDALPDLVAEVPEDVPVVVLSTLVCYQLAADVRETFEATLEDRMRERPLVWLSGDDLYEENEGIHLTATHLADGDVVTDHLAGFQQHGVWLEWHHDGA